MKILFICKGNTCRSPIAEGLAKRFYPSHTINSAGIRPEQYVNPFAVSAMNEVSIDISEHTPKHIREYRKIKYDIVVCFGEDVYIEATKYFNQDRVCYYDVTDPAGFIGTNEEILEFYRKTREHIKDIVTSFNLKGYQR